MLKEERNLGNQVEAFTRFVSSIVSGYWSVLAWLNLRDLVKEQKSFLRRILPSRKDQIKHTWNWPRFPCYGCKGQFLYLCFKHSKSNMQDSLQILGITFYCGKLLYRATLVCMCWGFFFPLELGSYPGLNASSSYLYFPRLTVQPVNFPFYALQSLSAWSSLQVNFPLECGELHCYLFQLRAAGSTYCQES